MDNVSPPSFDSKPSSGAPSVDGVSVSTPQAAAPAEAPEDKVLKKEVQRSKAVIIMFVGFPYALYVIWCVALMVLLPSPTGQMQSLQQIGLMSVAAGAGVFVFLGLFLFQRIARADVAIATRQVSLVKMAIAVLPGIVISAAVPFVILQSPPLTMSYSPMDPSELVAPLPITLDVKDAVQTLTNLGKKPVQYVWDTNGDGKPEETTMVPEVTVNFDRAGSYTVTARIDLSDKTSKRITTTILIQSEVFSISPLVPIVEKPVRFSVADLLKDPKLLKDVQWDYDGDGVVDETVKGVDTLHTYYAIGKEKVRATVELTDSTQRTYERIISIGEPPPLPFPVTLTTDPKNVIGPAPFGVFFTLDTKQTLSDIEWDFGDGKVERGPDLKRIGHTFDTAGIYSVVTTARSGSGKTAELTTLVRATQKLQINDLSFEGSPDVKNFEVTGEVPLTVQLTPKTTMPLVHFSWEAPDDADAQITGDQFQAVYRKEGSYVVTLVAQDADVNTMRQPIKITVNPPSAEPEIDIQPDGGVAPLHVAFDASNTFIPTDQTIAGFKWLFGDEKTTTNSELGGSRVEHTYTDAGEYKITLTVVMTSGKEFTANRTIVVRKPALSACITASRLTVSAGKGIQFDSSCSTGNPTTYLWDIHSVDKPNIVVAQSPDASYLHVFDQPGDYVITLTIHSSGDYADSKSITVTVTP
jgi:PKD repeat protein